MTFEEDDALIDAIRADFAERSRREHGLALLTGVEPVHPPGLVRGSEVGAPAHP